MDKKIPAHLWLSGLLCAVSLLLSGACLWGLNRMDRRLSQMDSRLDALSSSLDSRLESVGEEMARMLAEQASLIVESSFHYNIQTASQKRILLSLNANLKQYNDGTAATFSVTCDDGETILARTNVNQGALSANITLPLCETIQVGLILTTPGSTQTQPLGQIDQVSALLTDHLYLTPDLTVTQSQDQLLLTGSFTVLDTLAHMENKQLAMSRLEIRQNDALAHTFYFSELFDSPLLEEGSSLYSLTFDKIPVKALPGSTITLTVRSRDKAGFEYLCPTHTIQVDENGALQETQPQQDQFTLVY